MRTRIIGFTAAASMVAAAVFPLHAQEPAGSASARGVLYDATVISGADRDRIDALFTAFDRPGSPGAVVGVIRHGQLVYARGYGEGNLEYGIPLEPASIFHVASVSKHVTAFAIGLLAEEGRLSWDDDVRQYVPELHDFGPRITLRHLATHTSGLRDQWELLAVSGWRLDDVITREHVMKTLLLQRELNFQPGSQYLYSNSGYSLLAEIVERVTGQTFAAFAQERIFRPLGMTATHVHDDHQHIVPNRAYSYTQTPTGFQHAPLNYANHGATSLFTTVADMARWERNLREPRVGSRELIALMEQYTRLTDGGTSSYGLGFQLGERGGERMVHHGGADAGYRTTYVRLPDTGWAFVVFSNLASTNPGQLAQRIADVLLGEVVTPAAPATPSPRRRTRATAAEVTARAGTYVDPETDASRTLEVRDGRLFFLLGPGWELVPTQSGSWATTAAAPGRLEVTFESGRDGSVLRMRERVDGGAERVFERVPSYYDPERLREYVGTYYSPELGTSYTLDLVDRRLVARHRRHEDIALQPTLPDRLQGSAWYFRSVRFTRDTHGRVEGLRLNGDRVRNLAFIRLEPAAESPAAAQ
jgi:CubicO group peptidase (beta-lactamase class C family)